MIDHPTRERADPAAPARLRRGLWLSVAILWLGLLGGGAAGVKWYLDRAERALEASVTASAIATIDALNQSLLRTLEAVQGIHALLQTRHNLLGRDSERGAAAIAEFLSEVAERETFGILQVATADAQGMLSWSSVLRWQPVSLADREHVRVHFDRPAALFVSVPLVGRVSGRWSVQITYPLVDSEGRFDGVAIVSLDPMLLSRRMAEIVTAEGTIAALLRLPEGELLARSHDAEWQLDRPPLPGHPAVRGALEAERGAMRTHSAVDGREFILAFRRIRGTDMVLAFSEDWAVASLPLIGPARWAWWSYTLIMLLLLLGALSSWRAAGLRAARKELARVEENRIATQAAWLRLEHLLQAAPAAIYAGHIGENSSGEEAGLQIEFFSPNLPRVIGWDSDIFAEQARWRAQMDAAAWADRPAFYRTTLDEGRAVMEYRWRWPDGSWRWLREEARLIEESDAGSFNVVGYLLDVTEQRKAEAWAAASARLNMLGELAANMAHELNQPLAVISLAAENAAAALEHDGTNGIPDAMETLGLVSLQATRCKAVVQHLRLFSSPDQRQSVGDVKLETIVEGTMLLVRGALRDAGITLTIELPADLPHVRANAVGAEQVFVNLFLNARDALAGLAPGTPRCIWITASQEEDRLRVIFADSGGGIPHHLLNRVFEPFFTTKGNDKGTGLGLSICQAAMRGFGGEISVCNGPLGAEFNLDFPLAEGLGSGTPHRRQALVRP